MNKDLISNLTDEQLDELLAYVPAFSKENVTNIKTRAFAKISQSTAVDLRDAEGSLEWQRPSPYISDSTRQRSLRKWLLTAAAAVMLMITSTAVLAGTTDFSSVFSRIFFNPTPENIMEPGKSVEADGIRMTLLYAYTDGTLIYILLELQDLEGDRLSRDMRLVNNHFLRQQTRTRFVYSEVPGRYLYAATIMPGRPVGVGDDFRFFTDAILIGTHFRVGEKIDFPLLQYAVQRDMIPGIEWDDAVKYRIGFSPEWPDVWINTPYSFYWEGIPMYLQPGEMYKDIPGIDWAVITNIGFYNGMLHIQTRSTDAETHYNQGNFILVDKNGEKLWAEFIRHSPNNIYLEYVFEIGDVENLENWYLAFNGHSVDVAIHGPWNFDFPITVQAQKRALTVQLQDSAYVTKLDIEITPMTTTISFHANQHYHVCDEDFFQVVGEFGESLYASYITLKDGRNVSRLERRGQWGCDGHGQVVIVTGYFDIEQLYSITIRGWSFDIQTE